MTIDFQSLISLSPNPYVLMDRNETIIWMNDAYLRATMRTRESIIGRRMFDAFPSEPGTESYELLSASLKRVVETAEVDEIALIRYDIASPDGSMEQRYWSATHTPLLDSDGRVDAILQHTVDVTELHRLRCLRDESGLVRRADAVQHRNLDLQAQRARLTRMFEQAPGFMAVLVGPEHEFAMVNAAYTQLVGREKLVGRRLADALPEVVSQGSIALLDEVRLTGRPYHGRSQEIYFEAVPGAPRDRRFLDFIYQPIFEDGEVSAIFVQGQDMTEVVEAARHQDLLINELNHRVKNTLAIVQSLASQSFRNVEMAGSARQSFEERLRALAGAHNLLTDASWRTTLLDEVVREATAPAAGADACRIEANGPVIALSPRLTVALTMALHELTTNAMKYGALSNDAGRICIAWFREAGNSDYLVLDWQELGGPPVRPSGRKGFGSRLIERGLAAEYGGKAELDFREEGLHCRIVLYAPEVSAA
ncbi:sensor histidine kinase [Novosphingobium sp. PY1]|uniref:sensor histidine kinase n=1 Tax=Novosphingobium sp. PY1 TaxID=1882221 RepID=UPI001AA1DFBC|nr:HWE histidine kinase domain-containing protein [Novosphingobium sp. PY1]GFM28800.1 signal transduction histidine kinase [Novosphingobium sp. PY1]